MPVWKWLRSKIFIKKKNNRMPQTGMVVTIDIMLSASVIRLRCVCLPLDLSPPTPSLLSGHCIFLFLLPATPPDSTVFFLPESFYASCLCCTVRAFHPLRIWVLCKQRQNLCTQVVYRPLALSRTRKHANVTQDRMGKMSHFEYKLNTQSFKEWGREM